MAAHERGSILSIDVVDALAERLSKVLPEDFSFNIYHVSTPPTRTDAIFAALPGTRPDRTYCESHFLSISIKHGVDGAKELAEVLVFAIEVLVYSTAHNTTFFVSKADSTGYLHLLGLPRGCPSPLRDICSTFLKYLVNNRRRLGIRNIVSLFARAQDQYLFPGSVDNNGKHVLDDRGLIRWWCRVLSGLLDRKSMEESQSWKHVQGHLVVPGLDKYENIQFVPRELSSSWSVGLPLKDLSHHTGGIPPRCLIPRFPDDPKARFLDELDNELGESSSLLEGSNWKSVKSLEQFWEMMAFRQECSAGRLVGFIWVVFTPDQELPMRAMTSSQETLSTTDPDDQAHNEGAHDGLHPDASRIRRSENSGSKSQDSLSSMRSAGRGKKRLRGEIHARAPRIKTRHRDYTVQQPESTPYYTWPSNSRAQVVLDERGYKRMTELLLRLDFSNLELATSSSRRWISEVRSGASGTADSWGTTITGTRKVESRPVSSATSGVATLSTGLVRKKRKVQGDTCETESSAKTVPEPLTVNVLGGNMIRKKAKS